MWRQSVQQRVYTRNWNHVSTCFTIWVWVNAYRYIFSGMNIHLPAILGFTRYQGFDPSPFNKRVIFRRRRWSTTASSFHCIGREAPMQPSSTGACPSYKAWAINLEVHPIHKQCLAWGYCRCVHVIYTVYIYLNNNQILSHIVKHMSLISLWQC